MKKVTLKAVFDLDKCNNCPFFDTCPTKTHRNEKNNTATFKFSTNDVLRQERHKNIQNIGRRLRAGVEPLMGLFHTREKHTGKLRVRGTHCFGLGVSHQL
ncbi:MAG: transposase [Sphingobacteriales bacterium]|nr:transposase [Sphingobacteriales bacterium]